MFVRLVSNQYGKANMTELFDGFGKSSTNYCERDKSGFSSEVVIEVISLAILTPLKLRYMCVRLGGIDVHLNRDMRSINGTLMATPRYVLQVLCNIETLEL